MKVLGIQSRMSWRCQAVGSGHLPNWEQLLRPSPGLYCRKEGVPTNKAWMSPESVVYGLLTGHCNARSCQCRSGRWEPDARACKHGSWIAWPSCPGRTDPDVQQSMCGIVDPGCILDLGNINLVLACVKTLFMHSNARVRSAR